MDLRSPSSSPGRPPGRSSRTSHDEQMSRAVSRPPILALAHPSNPIHSSASRTQGKGKAGEISRLTIHLDDPEANRFARLFKSGWWIFFMQFLMPIGLLTVCANAFAQILIERCVRTARWRVVSDRGRGQMNCLTDQDPDVVVPVVQL